MSELTVELYMECEQLMQLADEQEVEIVPIVEGFLVKDAAGEVLCRTPSAVFLHGWLCGRSRAIAEHQAEMEVLETDHDFADRD